MSTRSPHSIAILFFVSVPLVIFSQPRSSKILQYDQTPLPGKVTLLDRSELIGDIVFNDNDGIVTLISGNEPRAFNAKNILSFEFFKHDSVERQLYYALEFLNPEDGIMDSYFFEVLKELPTFAVVMKIERIKTQNKQHILLKARAGPALGKNNQIRVEQDRVVYFMNMEGEFDPYLKIREIERNKAIFDVGDFNWKDAKFINANLFQKYTGKHFDSLSEFARQNEYSFKNRDDLIKLLNEYERLVLDEGKKN